MGTILDDLDDHEGYGARRLPDGTITAGWTAETAEFEAHVAACSCGWHGGGEHPATEDGYDSAVDQWEHDHARPLLAETVPADVTRATADTRQAIGNLARQRPRAALRAVDELAEWTAAMRRRLALADPADRAARMRSRLDQLVGRDGGRAIGR